MKKIFFISITLLLVVLASCTGKKNQEETKGPVIIAYLTGHNGAIDITRIAANKVTFINYVSAKIEADKATLANEAVDSENIKALTGLKEQNPNLKILISIGNSPLEQKEPAIALTAEGQQTFVKSAVEILKRYDLDGIDIDGQYSSTYAAIRAELDALEKEADRKYLLTASVEGREELITNTDIAKAQEYLNYVNVRTYGFQSGDKAAHHTNLSPADKYSPSESVSKSIQAYIEAGVPAGKLTLSVASYGRFYELKKGWDKGLGDALAKQLEVKDYSTIKDSLVNKLEYYRYWDDAAQAPYLFNFYKGIFVTYDDEESAKAKSLYALTNELGGIALWDYNSDSKGFLLNAINQTLK